MSTTLYSQVLIYKLTELGRHGENELHKLRNGIKCYSNPASFD